MSTRRPYPTDLSDDEWRILEPLVPDAKPGGRPRAHKTRELLNAIFYVLRGGCAWRLLPHFFFFFFFFFFFLPWQSAYHYFRAWRMDGNLGADTHHPAREVASLSRPRAHPQRRHHRLPNGQDHRERRSSRLRWWQEDER